MVTLLHSSRAINITTVLLGILATLYGFNSILGDRGGILRQLMVALPAAGLFGTAGYLSDVWGNHIYSNILRSTVTLPAGVDPALIVGLESAVFGFLMPFLIPNAFRVRDFDKPSVLGIAFYAIASFISLGFSLLTWVLFLQEHHHLPFGWMLPRFVVFIAIVIMVSNTVIINVNNLLQRRPGAGSEQTSSMTGPMYLIVTVISLIIFVGSLFIIVPMIAFTGWAILVYILVFLLIFGVLELIQFVADKLPRSRLVYLALGFAMLAGALQLYQAIVL